MTAPDEGDGPLETRGVLTLTTPPVAVAHVHLVLVSVHDRVPGPLGQRLPRHVEGEAEVVGEGREDADEVVRHPRTLRPRGDGALTQGEVLVGHDEFGVDLEFGADAGALRAGAEGAVEREGPGLDLVGVDDVVVGAGHALGEPALARQGVRVARVGVLGDVDEVDDDHAVGQSQGRLDAVGEAPDRAGVGPLGHEPVDDHLDGVLLLLLQLGRLGEGDDCPVDPGARVALGLQLGEEVDVLPLRPLTSGASTWNRVRSGSSSSRSTICCGLCRVIGSPHVGQCGRPARA
ncbi:hypothetical protein GCM10025883_15140 [Mobilicoccus caccae]|uniref:Uncharacterized protein n=1 Tax=Mobilicoccus caccae TaxID=1859295 RepID=A0ABQ6IPS0_9MICO|nr:hypothetical protein GCM10025883_15140 [Mobilicoccus caccae]